MDDVKVPEQTIGRVVILTYLNGNLITTSEATTIVNDVQEYPTSGTGVVSQTLNIANNDANRKLANLANVSRKY
jgi:hypothetical protein